QALRAVTGNDCRSCLAALQGILVGIQPQLALYLVCGVATHTRCLENGFYFLVEIHRVPRARRLRRHPKCHRKCCRQMNESRFHVSSAPTNYTNTPAQTSPFLSLGPLNPALTSPPVVSR